MNIGFWFDYDQTYTFTALFNELKRRMPNARASGFVINDRYWAHARKALPADARLLRLYDLVREGLQYQPTAQELDEFSAFDEQHRLARVAYSDRHLRDYTQDQLVRLYAYLLRRFRAYVDEARPEVFLFNCVASQFAHLFYLVLRERAIKVVIPFSFGLDDLVYLADNPYLTSPEIWRTYETYRAGVESPPEESVRWAKEVMERIRSRGSAYDLTGYMKLERQRFRIPGPRAALAYLYNHFRYYGADPTLPSIRERLVQLVQLRQNRRKAKQLFVDHEQALGANFVFFPLHFEPEIATLVLSQYDQMSVIDIVARQLPITWKLAVKDHPVMIGRRSYKFFQVIQERYPNVAVVDPAVGSQVLVRKARAVLTLSGTVALEAMLMGTPVIFTSQTRFGGFDLGTFSQDLLNFGPVLERALARKYDDCDLIRMLVSIQSCCERFEMAEPLGRPSVLLPDNIARIADALLRKLQTDA